MILDEIGNKGQIERKIYQRRLPENPNKDYYYIMRETPNTEAVLIEYGFIDNPKDLNKLQNNLLDYAEGVVKAVTNYIGVPYTNPNEMIDEPNIYIVQRGDTLYKIARDNNISVDELRRANNLNTDILIIGQKLIIPTEKEVLQDDYVIYTVKNGDTLFSIARQYNVSIEELLTLNKLNSVGLTIGQQLLIPKNGIQIMGVVDYTIKKGDTLWKIANNCNVTVDDIVKLNKLDSTIIYPGQIIKLSEGCAAKQNGDINVENQNVYTVKRGDTLYSISRMFNTTPNKIINDNNLESTVLQIGQQLIVPIDNYIEYQVQPEDTLYSIARRYNTTPNIIRELNRLNGDYDHSNDKLYSDEAWNAINAVVAVDMANVEKVVEFIHLKLLQEQYSLFVKIWTAGGKDKERVNKLKEIEMKRKLNGSSSNSYRTMDETSAYGTINENVRRAA